MQVLKNNFESSFALFAESLKRTDFVAIDAEFTGLSTSTADRIDLFDTLQKRYEKVRLASKQFLIMQVGLCLFSYCSTKKVYEARPFNFYVFPRSGSSQLSLHKTFLSQPDSLQFLASNNFDFNKWVREGVPYLHRRDESILRQRVDTYNNDIDVDEKGQVFLEASLLQAHDWMQNGSKASLTVLCATSYHKRLIHQEIRKKYNGFVSTENTRTAVILKKLTVEERAVSQDQTRKTTLNAEIDELVGFRRVLEAVSESKKPIVGHNMLMDLCLMYNQFLEDLPSDVNDFKTSIHSLFPSIYDTKHVTTQHPKLIPKFPGTMLSDIHAKVVSAPFLHPTITFADDCQGYNETSEQLHEAGYDAYITGLVFARTHGFLEGIEDEPLDFDSDLFKSTNNKLHLMRSPLPFMDLIAPESRDVLQSVFLIHGFPDAWQSADIYHAFKDCGSITLKWVDKTQCLVMIRDADSVTKATALMNNLMIDPNPLFQIKSADSFVDGNILEGFKPKASEDEALQGIKRKRPEDDDEELVGQEKQKKCNVM